MNISYAFFFRKFEIYSMEKEWVDHSNLQELRVAVASCGGPIAVVRDDRKFTAVPTSGKPIIFIFSPSGELISSFKVDTLNKMSFQ